MKVVIRVYNLEKLPKAIGDYMVWTNLGFRKAYWNSTQFIDDKSIITDDVYYWAEIPSVESLDVGMDRESGIDL